MLESGWVEAHDDAFDVFHIQFGFDAQQPLTLTALCDAFDRHGKPMVYTVHDLRNPHHVDSAAHDARTWTY
jgi:hypothetical protein